MGNRASAATTAPPVVQTTPTAAARSPSSMPGPTAGAARRFATTVTVGTAPK